ncbi:hypothetical protein ACS0TY_032510 [Phlomoides rotata]
MVRRKIFNELGIRFNSNQTGTMRNQGELGREFKIVWNKVAPLKVSAMSWRLLRDRLPTRKNIARRGILVSEDDKRCTFCNLSEETADHFFLQCLKTDTVWWSCYHWIGCPYVQHNHPNTTSWCTRVFFMENGEMIPERIIDEVKGRVWSWCHAKKIVDSDVSFVELCNSPGSILVR